MEQQLFNYVEIFMDRCEISRLHCYEITERDNQTGYRCDYNKESTFEIIRYDDIEKEEHAYTFIDFHDTDGCYDKCDIERGIEIMKSELNQQEVIV